MQEPGVGVLFHQAVDFHLGHFKTALCGLCYVPLDGHLGVVVDVDLNKVELSDENRVHILNPYFKDCCSVILDDVGVIFNQITVISV